MSNYLDNFGILCRLCLSEDGKVPIFPDEENEESDLSEKIFQCVSIQVKNGSKLPLNVCTDCISHIESWSNFRGKCHENQAVLTSLVKDPQETADASNSGVVNGTNLLPSKDAENSRVNSARVPYQDGNHVAKNNSTGKARSNNSRLADTRQANSQEQKEFDEQNDSESVPSQDEPIDQDEDDDSVDEELTDKQVVNPKFTPKSRLLKPQSSVDQDSDDVRIIDSPVAPRNVVTVDLCDDDDEPEASSDKRVSTLQKTLQDKPGTSLAQVDLRIESAVTLPTNEMYEDGSKESAPPKVTSAPEGVEDNQETASRGSSRGNSPDRMSAAGSDIEKEGEQLDDIGESQDGSSRPMPTPDVDGDFSQATLDSTMVDSNAEEPEPFVPVSMADIKKEVDRGYGDEDSSLSTPRTYKPYPQSQTRSREEYEREALAADHTVDPDNERCIICDHKFHSLTSLLRHTKCKTHIINRSITLKREAGAPVDPRLIAQHERNMMSYKKQWNSGKKRNYPSLGTSKSGKFTCKLCNVVHISARDLERHRQSKKHKLYSLMGGPPPEVDPPKRKVIKPQHLQYKHDEAPQHLVSNRKVSQSKYEREYICPIPNCGYVCYEGSTLLMHMTSHGIQGQNAQLPAQSQPTPSLPQKVNNPASDLNSYSVPTNRYPQSRYENLFCPYHNAYFDTARGYLNHIRSCTMAPPISSFLKKEHQSSNDRYCKLCDINFSSHDMFVQHLRVYHKGSSIQQEQESGKMKVSAPVYTPKFSAQAKSNRKHKCHICGRVFNLLHSLNFHLRSHQQNSGPPVRPVCKVCKKSFATRKACASHLKTHFLPPGSNKLFCSACYKTFDTRTEICRHRFDGTCHPVPASQGGGDSFPCDQCSSTFNDRNTLTHHKLRYHPEVKKENIDDEYEDDSKMSAHIEQEDDDEFSSDAPAPTDLLSVSYQPEPTYCVLCDKNFPTFEMMRKHCRFVHRMPEEKIKRMVSTFSDGDSLPSDHFISSPVVHPSVASRSSGQGKACGHCGEAFTNMKLFHEHLQMCHNVESFMCPQCGMATDGQGCQNCNLPSSEAANDGNGLLFKCPIGHMSFNDENAMLKHYSYCTGNCGPYYECGSCGCEFKYRKNFDFHDCALSRRKSAYECSECHRSFSKKTYLMNHEMKCPGLNNSGYAGENPSAPSQSQQSSNSLKKTRQSGPIDEEGEEDDPMLEEEPQEPTTVFPCDQCDKIFHSQKALNGHGWVHKKSTPTNQMFCKFCGRENLALSNLYPHIYKCVRSLFLTEEVLTCEECSTFLSRYDTPKELSSKLHNHVLNCYPIPWYQNEGDVDGADKLLCYLCCHAFSSVESLTIHKEQHKRAKAKRNSPFLKSSPRKRPRVPQPLNYPAPQLDFDINEMIEEEEAPPEEFSEESCASESTSNASATKFIMNCQVCNRQFYNIDKLRNHEKVHGIVRQVVSEGEEEGSNEKEEEGDGEPHQEPTPSASPAPPPPEAESPAPPPTTSPTPTAAEEN